MPLRIQTFRFARPHARPSTGRQNKWLSLTAMAISSGVTSIPTSAVVLALPKIHQEFNASQGELQWTIVGFSLAYSALLIVAGRMSDIFGRKRFFLAGTIVYIAGAVGAAVAQSMIVLILLIIVMGIGAAILTPASLSIITDAFEPAQRGTAIGLWAASSAFISGVGPALGGILADWDWRTVFWINVPLAVLFFVIAMFATRESKDPDANRRIDIGGLATLSAGLTAISLVLNEGQEWGWTSPASLILFGATIVLLAAFVVIERRTANPLVDFSFFRKRNFTGGNIGLFAVNFVLAAVIYFMSLYMQELLGYTPLKSGVLLLPLSATMVLLLPLGGPISERIGPRIPIAAGLVLTALGSWLFTRIDATSGYNDLWPAMLVVGAGVGLSLTPINTAAMNSIRRAEHGAAAGILVTLSGLGAIFGVAVSGALFQSVMDSRSDKLLGKIGLSLSDAIERTLDGFFAGAKSAVAEMHKFTTGQQHDITHALREGFTYALGDVMWLSVAVALLGVAFVLLVMQRSAPIPDEEEEEGEAAAAVEEKRA